MDTKALEAVALSVRTLTMDAVQQASSGHPGLPMGCAEVGSYLFGEALKHDPADPGWIDRDRFVLSAGHGCMLLYALLHLSGYDLSLEDLKRFRELGSRTPGHPEYGHTPGVEATAGPLGQGISNAVGMAIAESMLAARFNTEKHTIIDHYTYVLASDGDLMEGVSSEACSLAGHLGLGKLIVYYDSNHITIEGDTAQAFTEDVMARFRAYGWHTAETDGYDLQAIDRLTKEARAETARPSIIMLHTTIAKGTATMQGSAKAHGAPLGEQEIRATKRALGISEDAMFYVAPRAGEYFTGKRAQWRARREQWRQSFDSWARENPEKKQEWDRFFASPDLSGLEWLSYQAGEKLATRKASAASLNRVAAVVPNLVGGSADLSPSNNTVIEGEAAYSRDSRWARNFHFGVREHGMGAVCNGMALHGGLRPYCATFMVFSDYMRPTIRLAAMMKLPVIYVFTHDSVYVGEDGPTHQPVEHLAALRVIPGLVVLRPGDAEETDVAWRMAVERTGGPTVLALTRQSLEVYPKHDPQWRETIRRGAYVVSEAEGAVGRVIVATGSEVNAALQAKAQVNDPSIRVVSMISRELFLSQDQGFQQEILPAEAPRLVVEAGVRQGWEGIAGGGRIVSLDRFGVSGEGKAVGRYLGVDAQAVVEALG